MKILFQNDGQFIQALICQMKHFVNKNIVHCYSSDFRICRWGLCHTPAQQVSQCIWWHHFYNWSQRPCLYRNSEWLVGIKYPFLCRCVIWELAWTNDGQHQAIIIWTHMTPVVNLTSSNILTKLIFWFKEHILKCCMQNNIHFVLALMRYMELDENQNCVDYYSRNVHICKYRTCHSAKWRVNQCVWWQHFYNWS